MTGDRPFSGHYSKHFSWEHLLGVEVKSSYSFETTISLCEGRAGFLQIIAQGRIHTFFPTCM